MVRTLIIGDSHVRRFNNHLKHIAATPEDALRLDPKHKLLFYGISGGSVGNPSHTAKIVVTCQSFLPDYVILWIGGNDLDTKDGSVEFVSAKIIALATMLLGRFHLRGLYLPEQMGRTSTRCVPTTRFQQMVQCLNSCIKEQVVSYHKLHWWKMRHFNSNRSDTLCDGIHLNNKGQTFLFHNLRGAIIRCV